MEILEISKWQRKKKNLTDLTLNPEEICLLTGDYTVAKYFVLDQHTRVPEMVIASKKDLFGKVKILAGLFLFRNNPEKFIFVI